MLVIFFINKFKAALIRHRKEKLICCTQSIFRAIVVGKEAGVFKERLLLKAYVLLVNNINKYDNVNND
jgi:hypothetical protein